ncbi:regulator of protease activity HflC (stomatin/prohibitin superfamily) [Paraburkholderia sp. CI3]
MPRRVGLRGARAAGICRLTEADKKAALAQAKADKTKADAQADADKASAAANLKDAKKQ